MWWRVRTSTNIEEPKSTCALPHLSVVNLGAETCDLNAFLAELTFLGGVIFGWVLSKGSQLSIYTASWCCWVGKIISAWQNKLGNNKLWIRPRSEVILRCLLARVHTIMACTRCQRNKGLGDRWIWGPWVELSAIYKQIFPNSHNFSAKTSVYVTRGI